MICWTSNGWKQILNTKPQRTPMVAYKSCHNYLQLFPSMVEPHSSPLKLMGWWFALRNSIQWTWLHATFEPELGDTLHTSIFSLGSLAQLLWASLVWWVMSDYMELKQAIPLSHLRPASLQPTLPTNKHLPRISPHPQANELTAWILAALAPPCIPYP